MRKDERRMALWAAKLLEVKHLKVNILNPKPWSFFSDDFPLQLGDFLVQHVNFHGCKKFHPFFGKKSFVFNLGFQIR